MDYGFKVLDSGFFVCGLGFRIPIFCGIPGSLSCITDSRTQDFGFHQIRFLPFRIPEAKISRIPEYGFPYIRRIVEASKKKKESKSSPTRLTISLYFEEVNRFLIATVLRAITFPPENVFIHFTVGQESRVTRGICWGKTRGWIGFSALWERRIGDIVLTAKERSRGRYRGFSLKNTRTRGLCLDLLSPCQGKLILRGPTSRGNPLYLYYSQM